MAQGQRTSSNGALEIAAVRVPSVGVARAALTTPGFRWDSLSAPTLTVYVQPGSYAAAHAAELQRRAEVALHDALAVIGTREYPGRLRVFYVDSREQMRALVGAGTTGWTVADAHAVFLVANQAWSPFAHHEIMHAASLTVWGEPRGLATWLREGLAAATEDRCGPSTGRGAAAQLLAEGRLARPEVIIASFDSLAHIDDLAAYLEAGALVQYLLARYGRDSLARVWRGGLAEFPHAYGRTAAAVGPEWLAWLARTPRRERPPSYASLRARGCG
jgi:hypothetical protein